MITIPDVKLVIPTDVLAGCDKLLKYDSNDTRDVIKTTIKNHNIYFLCASKMGSAISFIEILQKDK